jgi:signal transduction histidine kinase
MTSIKGYAEALADGVIDTSDMESTGALLNGEANRLERLVSDLLDLARAGAVDFRLSMSQADLSAIARDAADAWTLRAARDNVDFVADISTDPISAVVDPTRVRQIIDNLIENAFRITPAGGNIVLTAQMQNDSCYISVEDSGPGLSDEDLAVAFQPAVLHSRYRGIRPVGTGLGLALVGRLAQRMSGTAVAAHSRLGGAAFRVDFPKSES